MDSFLVKSALAATLALAIVVIAMPFLMRLAERRSWVDCPNQRKRHTGSVPLVGGMAIVLAMAVVTVVFGLFINKTAGLIAGGLLIFAVGFADDIHPIRARFRFAVHVVATLGAIFLDDIQLHHLGHLVGPFTFGLGWLGVYVTVVGIAAVVNAFNWIDGVDGLAGGVSLSALIWFGTIIATIAAQRPDVAGSAFGPAVFALAGAVAGFLCYNLRTPRRKRAAVFLGDGGSMLLGFILAWLAVRLTMFFGAESLSPITAVWVMAVPLFDMLACFIRRVAAGHPPMKPDRRHLHHVLADLGFPVAPTIAVVITVNFVMGAIGFAAWRRGVPDYLMFWSYVALFAVYLAGMWHADRRIAAGRPVPAAVVIATAPTEPDEPSEAVS